MENELHNDGCNYTLNVLCDDFLQRRRLDEIQGEAQF